MAREESSSKRRKRRTADDIDVPSIKKTGGGKSALLIVMLVGGAVLLLLCLIGTGIGVFVALNRDVESDRFVGSWKGRFVLRGQPVDAVYQFNKDGSLREQVFNVQGQQIHAGGGKWQFRGGEVEIDWDNGGFEDATAEFVDRNTMRYRIVDHSEFAQIGMSTTFKRQ